ncbi:hypothetical protein ITJ43_03440 [Microbacterium sp. VKM Ac-2870]|uniref:hypothetical protein n=1 Tax=Microbacterium sp. VKM Ac-2870 TaxID=2783825 RepID=UPI00188CADCD|nr:hypothetical protein [Microbacterium sp. VKM Ac-2870]MBF4561180.1 hypothetical protein [Microbacterium sp. VKM Ac-2870]
MNEKSENMAEFTTIIPLAKRKYWLGPSGILLGSVESPDDRIVDFDGITPDLVDDDFLTSRVADADESDPSI